MNLSLRSFCSSVHSPPNLSPLSSSWNCGWNPTWVFSKLLLSSLLKTFGAPSVEIPGKSFNSSHCQILLPVKTHFSEKVSSLLCLSPNCKVRLRDWEIVRLSSSQKLMQIKYICYLPSATTKNLSQSILHSARLWHDINWQYIQCNIFIATKIMIMYHQLNKNIARFKSSTVYLPQSHSSIKVHVSKRFALSNSMLT